MIWKLWFSSITTTHKDIKIFSTFIYKQQEIVVITGVHYKLQKCDLFPLVALTCLKKCTTSQKWVQESFYIIEEHSRSTTDSPCFGYVCIVPYQQEKSTPNEDAGVEQAMKEARLVVKYVRGILFIVSCVVFSKWKWNQSINPKRLFAFRIMAPSRLTHNNIQTTISQQSVTTIAALRHYWTIEFKIHYHHHCHKRNYHHYLH